MWCSYDLNQVAFYLHFLPPGPGRGNGTYQSIQTNVHASPSGTSLHFLRLSLRIPQVTDVRDLGVPLDTTFTASAHCIEAANTARRLLFLVRRSFCELSKTAFATLYCALVRPHLEYAMEANTPPLRADINQLERVQRLATRKVRGLRQVPYEERLRQHNLFSLERRRLRADLILAFKIFKREVDLNPSEFFLHPPRAGLRGHTHRLLQGPSRLRRRSAGRY